MSSGEIIVLVCVLCLVPVWAAASIILFALGAVSCGRLIDPYYDGGGSGGESDRCPVNPHGPGGGHRVEGPQDALPRGDEVDWWPQFERELGHYVEEQESCPSGEGATSAEPAGEPSGTQTRA